MPSEKLYEIRVLLLPRHTSCKLPIQQGVGVSGSRTHKSSYNHKTLATVRPDVVSITTYGFVAIAHVVEHIEPGKGRDLKSVGG